MKRVSGVNEWHKESPSRIIEKDRGSDQEHGGSHELAQHNGCSNQVNSLLTERREMHL